LAKPCFVKSRSVYRVVCLCAGSVWLCLEGCLSVSRKCLLEYFRPLSCVVGVLPVCRTSHIATRHTLLHVTHCVVGGMPVCRTSQIPACVQDVTNSCLCAGRHKFLPECRTSQIPACVQDVTNSCLCAGRHKFQLILLQISSRTAL